MASCVRMPKTSWDAVSDWYSDYLSRPGTVQSDIVFPGAYELLHPIPHGRYLDLACGQGAFLHMAARRMQRAKFVGIDASPSLIAKARMRAPTNISFTIGDATKHQDTLESGSFDGGTCLLALQNINPLEPAIAHMARVLKPGALWVIALNHPCFRQPRQSGWGFDEGRKLQYRRVDAYLSSYEMPIIAHPGAAPHVKTYSYHRPLSVYVALLAKHGFVVDTMEEWVSNKTSDSGPRARAENRARNEIPLFMAIRARKL